MRGSCGRVQISSLEMDEGYKVAGMVLDCVEKWMLSGDRRGCQGIGLFMLRYPFDKHRSSNRG